MKKARIEAMVEWTPRTGNHGATGDTGDFDDGNDLLLEWLILPRALGMGRQAEHEFSQAKQCGALTLEVRKQRRRKLEERLKASDPW